jgi:hypothetical protein
MVRAFEMFRHVGLFEEREMVLIAYGAGQSKCWCRKSKVPTPWMSEWLRPLDALCGVSSTVEFLVFTSEELAIDT